MTPLQVEFCYQVALGNVKSARILLPKLTGNDGIFKGTPSPAVFCLWAARQFDRQFVIDKLAKMYPGVKAPTPLGSENPVYIEKAVCEVLVPEIPDLYFLLSSIVKTTNQTEFETEALKFILDSTEFKDNSEVWMELTTKLQTLLEGGDDDTQRTNHTAPASVQAVLKQTPASSSVVFSTFFPGVGIIDHRPALDEQENNNIPSPKLSSAQDYMGNTKSGLFNARQLHGRTRAFGVEIAVNSPPPPAAMPHVLHQALSLDLVATNPLLKFRNGH